MGHVHDHAVDAGAEVLRRFAAEGVVGENPWSLDDQRLAEWNTVFVIHGRELRMRRTGRADQDQSDQQADL